jgi:putative transposase
MARRPRIHLPGGLYHVILRGNGGQPVFLTDEDRCRFYLLLQEGTCRFGYRVHAFCLMTNHMHLALQAGEIPLSRGLHNLSFRFTRWMNWRKNSTGHLFQGRFKAVLVDSDPYLLELVRYIHLNPVRAKLVKAPDEYPWSSHGAYLGKEHLPWITTDWMLSQLGKTAKKARIAYRAFVHDGLEEKHRPEFYGGGDDLRVLGNDAFIEKCLAGSCSRPLRLTVRDIAAAVCLAYNIDVNELRAKSQRRIISEARAMVGWLAFDSSNVTLTEVGQYVNRDVGSISSAVRRLSERFRDRPELTERSQALKNLLGGQS